MSEVLDKLGQPIVPGAYIVYPVERADSNILRVGKVRAVKQRKDDWNGHPQFSVTVIGVDDAWSRAAIKSCERAGTLLYVDRIVVIPESIVPAHYKELLNG